MDKRIGIVESIWVGTPEMARIIRQLDECRERSRLASEPRCMFIEGESGVGKSLTIRHYLDRNPRRRETDANGERTIIPVLSAMVPVPGSVGGLISELIRATGDPLWNKRTSRLGDETARLRTLIENCSIEMIILDEIQHLAPDGKESLRKSAADWVKNLITQTGIPVVIVGVPYASRLIDRHAQLRNRFSLRADLRPYDWKDRQSQKKLLKFLDLVDEELPFSARSGLAETETAMAIYQASSGLPRLFMKLIRSAAIRAIRQDAAMVRPEDLAVVYEEELNHFNGNFPNPFVTPPQLSRLVPSGDFAVDDE
ncbi:TniB family NTP-binding protein [Pelagibius sp. 7325]|uniref:TniB family NTP-binding protein n=1 Tax=Pelagibius sp. 7325 TaxID=3131994 RepID=UPI0030EE6B33